MARVDEEQGPACRRCRESEEGDARPHRLGQEVAAERAATVDEADAGGGGDRGEGDVRDFDGLGGQGGAGIDGDVTEEGRHQKR